MKCEMRGPMRVAGHGQIRAGSGSAPPLLVLLERFSFLIGGPVQYANTTLFGRARSTHFHITFLVGRSWIGLCGSWTWTRCECPSSDAATKLPCSQGQSDRWADALAFVMIWPIHERLVETKRNLGAVSFKASMEVSVQRPSVSDLKT
jgi:hypothetical protein